MVIKSRIRGNGGQLASYLLSKGENEQVRILEVDGMTEFSQQEFHELLRDMSLNEQLTRSRKGIYHAAINPSIDEAKKMSDADWIIAANILAQELGFEGQRRGIVYHVKNSRPHAHIAFERFDHEKGKMIGIAHNYRKQDKARARMETLFHHQPTAKRNPHRPVMKEDLTKLWRQSLSGQDFIWAARRQGYAISKGYDRTPFMVIDATGRSFNLVRHLDGIKTKEVRERFKDLVLPTEKDALAFARTQIETTWQRPQEKPKEQPQEQPQEKVKEKPQEKSEVKATEPAPEQDSRSAFMNNLAEKRQRQQSRRRGPRLG